MFLGNQSVAEEQLDQTFFLDNKAGGGHGGGTSGGADEALPSGHISETLLECFIRRRLSFSGGVVVVVGGNVSTSKRRIWSGRSGTIEA